MHVLVVKLSAIGDVVHALPAVAALRREVSDVRVTWVVERAAAAILRGSPAIDRLVEIDTRMWRRRLLRRDTRRSLIDRLSMLRAEPVDVALDFQGLLKSGLVAFASGAARRIGYATDALREPASRAFLNEQVMVDDGGHVIEKNLALVRHLGVEARGDYEFPIAVPESLARDLEARLPTERFAILNPGGGWETKLWPAERFGELAESLWERHGLVSLVTYGPREEESGSPRRVVVLERNGDRLRMFAARARRARAPCRRVRRGRYRSAPSRGRIRCTRGRDIRPYEPAT